MVDVLKSPQHDVSSETFGLSDLAYDSNFGLTALEPGLQVLPLQFGASSGQHDEPSEEALLRTLTHNR